MRYFRQYRNHPRKFLRREIDWSVVPTADGRPAAPDVWQDALLRKLERRLKLGEPIRFAVASGHGVGKSALTAWIILWALLTRKDLSGVVTANTFNQLKSKTFRELALWAGRLKHKDAVRLFSDKIALSSSKTSFVSAIPWNRGSPEAFAGLHSLNTLMIFDEASAIDDRIWESAAGSMTSKGAMWFVFGNPTRNSGEFRRCFGQYSHRWERIRVDSREGRFTDKEQIACWEADYGTDSDFFRVRVRGEFPNQAENQFISNKDIEEAVDRYDTSYTSPPLPTSSPEYSLYSEYSPCLLAANSDLRPYTPLVSFIGVDVARFGEDSSVIAVRHGERLTELIRRRKLDVMELTEEVRGLYHKYLPKMVCVDETGIGAGVVDRLCQLEIYNVMGVNFAKKATEKKYYNKRTEIWGRMRDWLQYGAIPNDRELMEDLSGPAYHFKGDDGRIILEKKEDMRKRGLRSPDAGDALALTFACPEMVYYCG